MLRAVMIVSTWLIGLGCAGGHRVQVPGDGRLNGEWEIALTVLPATGESKRPGDSTAVRGTMAFVPNHAGARVPGFEGVPQQVGTHNLPLDGLVPGLDPRAVEPIAAASSAGDSVRIVIDPGAVEPVVLRGAWHGPVVMGEWLMHRRTGIDREGQFSLRRTQP